MAAQAMILVADDQVLIRDLIADMLIDEGYQVTTCNNGQEALTRLATLDPQLVITDMMMPVLDGWSFVQQLRQQDDWQHLPVIIISAAYDLPFNPKKLDRWTAFLAKPFDVGSLLKCVEASLGSNT